MYPLSDVEMISKFAQLEFKFGEPERGKTLFEGSLSSYPRRVNLWFVYMDQVRWAFLESYTILHRVEDSFLIACSYKIIALKCPKSFYLALKVVIHPLAYHKLGNYHC